MSRVNLSRACATLWQRILMHASCLSRSRVPRGDTNALRTGAGSDVRGALKTHTHDNRSTERASERASVQPLARNSTIRLRSTAYVQSVPGACVGHEYM